MVNDVSTDKSGEIAKQLEIKYKNIKYFVKKNSGASDTRNYGIKKACGDYLAFVDADDYVDNTFVEIYKYIKDDVDIILTGFNCIYKNRIKLVVYNKEKLVDSDIIKNCLQINSKMNSVWAKVVRKDFFVNNNLWFKNGFAEDYNWLGRSIVLAKKVQITRLHYYHYIAENLEFAEDCLRE